jgi:hypothetical protein
VAAVVGVPPGTAVEIPAHVGDDDAISMLAQPGDVDDRRDYGSAT